MEQGCPAHHIQYTACNILTEFTTDFIGWALANVVYCVSYYRYSEAAIKRWRSDRCVTLHPQLYE